MNDLKRDELKDDLEELKYLFTANLQNLNYFDYDLKKAQKFISSSSYHLIKYNLAKLITENKRYLKDLDSNRLEEYRELLRLLLNQSAALITSSDWQSPSFNHSLIANAGRQTGKISGTISDYKRDVHLDEGFYEARFLKEYIDTPFKFGLKAYLTNSGQAAFQTILTYLMAEKNLKGKILLGQSSYFQYKQILVRSFADKVILVKEENTDEILDQVEDDRPSVIFLDSLCNNATIQVPEISQIITYLNKNIKYEIYLIIDNTCLSVFCQPFTLKKNRKIHLITFESLNKYYQFGLDRVTGGVIICENRDAAGIFEYRKHSGTNINDSSVFALPTPNRKMLEKRLLRQQRNASMLANYLDDLLPNVKVSKIIHPGLKNHPANSFMKNNPFQGSFFNIAFKDKYNSPKFMKQFMDLSIRIARKKGVNLIAGTSFGLNTTRIYLTSLWNKYGQPFLRISAGTENIDKLEQLKLVFKETMEKF